MSRTSDTDADRDLEVDRIPDLIIFFSGDYVVMDKKSLSFHRSTPQVAFVDVSVHRSIVYCCHFDIR